MSPLRFFALTFFFLLGISQLESVIGHGYVHQVVVNGDTYLGWLPFSDPYLNPVPQTVVRKVINDGFVAAGDPNLNCHSGGREGTSAIAEAAAGSQVVFKWQYWPSDHQGPVSTYMASCNGDCASFDATTARWFKVDADGYANGQWAAARLINNGAQWTSTIPAQLAPGEYLMRNEIIALHSAGSPQFYPSCTQVRVTGSGTGQPSESDLVSIPELYNGVTFPDIYTDFRTFEIPGPAPVSFNGGGSPAPNPAPAPEPNPAPVPAPNPAPNPTSQPPVTGATPATTANGTDPSQTPGLANLVPNPLPSNRRCGLTRRRHARRRLSRRH